MSDRFDHKLKHTLESKADAADAAPDSFRRIELITGTGRRRHWSSDEKARILLESLQPGANVSDVARRNGLSPQQLFGWRREVRGPEPSTGSPRKGGRPRQDRSGTLRTDDASTQFAAVMVAASRASPPPASAGPSGVIEITIGDVIVRVSSQVDVAQLVAVLRAVRRAS